MKIEKIIDNFNRKIFFTFNNQGLVDKIAGENGKEAQYRYNASKELVSSRDVDGNGYGFKYSTDGRHNMTEIAYSDKTTLQLEYFGQDKFENIKKKKDRDGTVTEYGFELDKSNKDHHTVSIVVKGKDGNAISTSKYDYYKKVKGDGAEWTQRLVSDLDGDITDTTYHEQFGLPTVIKRGGEETTFAYDVKGRVVKKVNSLEISELAYDQQAGKVSKVVRTAVSDPKRKVWSEFKYDGKGNLTFAKNSDNKGVYLFYDGSGRIASMVDQDKRKITFKYNENSKPIEISDPALGTITVSYTNSGEIKKVDSTAGRKIAMQVTSAFQNLLDIIRPAGVTLNP